MTETRQSLWELKMRGTESRLPEDPASFCN